MNFKVGQFLLANNYTKIVFFAKHICKVNSKKYIHKGIELTMFQFFEMWDENLDDKFDI